MGILNYFDRTVQAPDKTFATLSEKHAPSTIDEFMGNYIQKQSIHKWFSSDQPSLLVHGGCGCGKTTLINLFVEHYKLHAFVNCSNNKRSKKELTQWYDKIKNNTNSVLIMDEVETLVTKNENMSVSEIAKWVSKENIRVIFITNSVILNKLLVLKDHAMCTVVEVAFPDPKTLFRKCLDVLEKEKVKFDDEDLMGMKRSIHSLCCDTRSVLDGLLISGFTQGEKDKDLDIYQAYLQIVSPSVTLSKKMQLFGVDSGTIPVLFQENYIDMDLSITERCSIGNRMSDADVFHKKMFMHASNNYVEMYAAMSSIFCEMSNNKVNKRGNTRPRFGLIWTKQSAMCQKKKYLQSIQQQLKLPFYNCNNFYFMYGFLRMMVDAYRSNPEDVSGLRKFIECYNIQEIETLFNLYVSFNIESKKVETKPLTKKGFYTMFSFLFQ
jgi:hypothetical protein